MEKDKFTTTFLILSGGKSPNITHLAKANYPTVLDGLAVVIDLGPYIPFTGPNRDIFSMVYPNLNIETIDNLLYYWEFCSKEEVEAVLDKVCDWREVELTEVGILVRYDKNGRLGLC